MAAFTMPSAVLNLSGDQQRAITGVLTKAGLLTAAGDLAHPTTDTAPNQQKATLKAFFDHHGLDHDLDALGIKPTCILARAAEAAAVAACAMVPGGPIAVAACIAAAHAAADAICNS
jgi:hypothetical protein